MPYYVGSSTACILILIYQRRAAANSDSNHIERGYIAELCVTTMNTTESITLDVTRIAYVPELGKHASILVEQES